MLEIGLNEIATQCKKHTRSAGKNAASANKRGKIFNLCQARENMRPIPRTTGIVRGKIRVRLVEIGLDFAIKRLLF